MNWRIGEILIQKKWISWEQLQVALEEQKETKELIGEVLVRKRFISEQLLYKALAEQYNTRFLDLKRTHINPKAVALIPKSVAEKYTLIPVDFQQEALVIAISTPLNNWPEAELNAVTKVEKIQTVLSLPDDVRRAIAENYTKN